MPSITPERPTKRNGPVRATALFPAGVTACPGCDLLLSAAETPPGHRLRCPRCGRKLTEPKKDTVNRVLALSLTALLLFIPAHFMPLLTFNVLGMKQSGSAFDSVTVLFERGFYLVALVVLLTGVIFPLLKAILLFAISAAIRFRVNAKAAARLLRAHHHLDEWAMTEVYLIGVLITIIKMYHLASVDYAMGFFCLIGLSAALVLASVSIDEQQYWRLIEKQLPKTKTESEPVTIPPEQQARRPLTAAAAGLAMCRICHHLTLLPAHNGFFETACPRCGATLHLRTPNSAGRTVALLICAVILAFPANILPIMEVEQFGAPSKSTIIDGITFFFQSGSPGIGLIIFTASILVPLFKILGMSIILLSVRLGRQTRLKHKIAMYRFIAFVGRWSMLDIFVIALLCALGDFGFFSSISAADAAVYFSGVVMATMLAATSFDPRLIWDQQLRPNV